MNVAEIRANWNPTEMVEWAALFFPDPLKGIYELTACAVICLVQAGATREEVVAHAREIAEALACAIATESRDDVTPPAGQATVH